MTLPAFSRTNLYLGTFCIVAALLLVLVWVPQDTGTGLLEKVRRQVTIGDALAPTLAAAVILIGGVLVFFQKLEPYPDGVTFGNLRFLGLLLATLALSFALMRWSGPVAVATANILLSEDMNYRALRDTAPWKYIGFVLGGGFLVTALISAVEGRVSYRAVMFAMITVWSLIAIFDLPFSDLLLPPNGDV